MAESIRISTAIVADDRYVVAVIGDSVHVHTTAEAEAVTVTGPDVVETPLASVALAVKV